MKYLEAAEELKDKINSGAVALFSRVNPQISVEEATNINSNYINGISFVLTENDKTIGCITLVEPKQNLFLSENNEPEIMIGEIFISNDYRGEGIEALLVEISMNYASMLERPLIVCKNILGFNFISNRFFETRGFVFEPVICNETVFVLGDNYKYNLKNIEKDRYKYLDKNKCSENKLNDKNLNKVIEVILAANDMENNDNLQNELLQEVDNFIDTIIRILGKGLE